jgi:glycosyltransferase involved in cell wall biosynthesis
MTPLMAEAFGVSVVVPIYNRPEKGRRAINSICQQTYPVKEVIVVDDGSQPPFILSDHQKLDIRVKVIRLEKNVGQQSARNIGIDAATAPLIAFCDSDDVWHSNKLEVQIAALSERGAQTSFLCSSNARVLRADGSARPFNFSTISLPIDKWILVDHNELQTSTFLLRREDARRFRFRNTAFHDDWDLALRLVEQGAAMIYVDQCLVDYDATTVIGRVSTAGTVAQSLQWIDDPQTAISKKVKHQFYIVRLFRNHLRNEKHLALARLWKHSTADWNAPFYTAQGFYFLLRNWSRRRMRLR